MIAGGLTWRAELLVLLAANGKQQQVAARCGATKRTLARCAPERGRRRRYHRRRCHRRRQLPTGERTLIITCEEVAQSSSSASSSPAAPPSLRPPARTAGALFEASRARGRSQHDSRRRQQIRRRRIGSTRFRSIRREEGAEGPTAAISFSPSRNGPHPPLLICTFSPRPTSAAGLRESLISCPVLEISFRARA